MKKILESLQDVEEAFNRLQEIEANMGQHTATANVEVTKIRSTLLPLTSPLESEAAEINAAIEEWAESHKKDSAYFPSGRRTLDLVCGTIQIRKDPPSIVLRKKAKTSTVIQLLSAAGKKIRDACIKSPEPTLDKAAIKKLYEAGELDDESLKEYGLEYKDDSESIIISTKTVDKYELA